MLRNYKYDKTFCTEKFKTKSCLFNYNYLNSKKYLKSF